MVSVENAIKYTDCGIGSEKQRAKIMIRLGFLPYVKGHKLFKSSFELTVNILFDFLKDPIY